MAIERTFSIIKPDATARNLTGAINAMIEIMNGLGTRVGLAEPAPDATPTDAPK